MDGVLGITSDIDTCSVDPGDLVLFHYSLYHRGQSSTGGDRMIVFFAFGENNMYRKLHSDYVRNRIQARLGSTLDEYFERRYLKD